MSSSKSIIDDDSVYKSTVVLVSPEENKNPTFKLFVYAGCLATIASFVIFYLYYLLYLQR
ncbi:ORF_116 [Adoxophyes orana granulovirus]|uniref:ADOR118 n=1 Tax=Adoxophyes orana granulovirus TaxID=170617 RepID=Q7T9P9_GVAO|nr:ORF_116 [Adoxophyes orana granulovirus]AAP85753.1 ORF_116 [Adoxophyes orana granulovirus]AJA91758.1 ADOR118 [Adoxophyes orana granulovirus]